MLDQKIVPVGGNGWLDMETSFIDFVGFSIQESPTKLFCSFCLCHFNVKRVFDHMVDLCMKQTPLCSTLIPSQVVKEASGFGFPTVPHVGRDP